MQNEIIILCNSPQCLNEISSGQWPNLNERNIFTCNLAYTFFRTNALHLNIFSDAKPILNFLTEKNWSEVYETYKYNKIEFILSNWELKTQNIEVKTNPHKNCNVKFSPIEVPGSSAINALIYLSEVENFDTIYLLGYTINEWEGIRNVKELQSKKEALERVLNKYKVEQIRDFAYKYIRV